MSVEAERPGLPRSAALRCLARVDPWWIAVALALALAVLLRRHMPTDENVAWLIEIAERTLAGARPYLDYIEVNPPAAMLLYLPAVALARALAIRSEDATTMLVFVGFVASMALSWRILRGSGLLANVARVPLLCICALVLLVLPAYTFAEREHIAVLALMPALAAFAVRCSGTNPARIDGLLAGIGIGVVVAVKPMFMLGIAGPVVILVAYRGWRAAAADMELWIGAIVAGLYGLAVLQLVPAFAEHVLPVAMAVYVPRRLPWLNLLWPIPSTPWLYRLLLLGYCARVQPIGPLATILASASVGFEAVVLLQGKGFFYHSYPAISLGLVALAVVLVDPRGSKGRYQTVLCGIFLLVSGLLDFVQLNRHYDPEVRAPGLIAAVRALAPKPSVLTLSSILALGPPLARSLGGVWAGSAPCTWITDDSNILIRDGAPAARFEAFRETERMIYAGDIVRHRPDAVLVDGALWQGWIDRSTELTAAMAAYRPDGTYGNVTLWVRKPDDERIGTP